MDLEEYYDRFVEWLNANLPKYGYEFEEITKITDILKQPKVKESALSPLFRTVLLHKSPPLRIVAERAASFFGSSQEQQLETIPELLGNARKNLELADRVLTFMEQNQDMCAKDLRMLSGYITIFTEEPLAAVKNTPQ